MVREPPFAGIWNMYADNIREIVLDEADIDISDIDLDFDVFSSFDKRKIRKAVKKLGIA